MYQHSKIVCFHLEYNKKKKTWPQVPASKCAELTSDLDKWVEQEKGYDLLSLCAMWSSGCKAKLTYLEAPGFIVPEVLQFLSTRSDFPEATLHSFP